MRTALNMAYIYRSPQMVQETLSLAESLTPGPLAPLTQLLIIAAWSSLESYNDMKNLEAGNRHSADEILSYMEDQSFLCEVRGIFRRND